MTTFQCGRTNGSGLNKRDRAAMKLALERVKKIPVYGKIARDLLRRSNFEEAGSYASFWTQMYALHLRPWNTPPCRIYDYENELGGDNIPQQIRCRYEPGEVELLRRMRALKISKWHPDPLGAIKEAEAKRSPANDLSAQAEAADAGG
jgi:hypothetical protein